MARPVNLGWVTLNRTSLRQRLSFESRVETAFFVRHENGHVDSARGSYPACQLMLEPGQSSVNEWRRKNRESYRCQSGFRRESSRG